MPISLLPSWHRIKPIFQVSVARSLPCLTAWDPSVAYIFVVPASQVIVFAAVPVAVKTRSNGGEA